MKKTIFFLFFFWQGSIESQATKIMLNLIFLVFFICTEHLWLHSRIQKKNIN